MKTKAKLKLWAILLLVFCVLFHKALYVYATGGSVTTTVKKLDHKIFDEKDKYLVFTEDGVYENTDSYLRFKFRSSDVQNSLEPGKRYTLYYYGWRIGFFSWYPNIYSVEPAQ